MYEIQVRQTDDEKPWYWRLVAKNGQVVLTSEGYSTKSNAIAAAQKFYTNWRYRKDALTLDTRAE